jgi:PAS domain S-box-containing protein
MPNRHRGAPSAPGTRTFLVLVSVWTLVAAGILGLILHSSAREDRVIALNRAMDSYQKDLVYRRWAALRGGVYVPADVITPPNPYLKDHLRRDVTTTVGSKLTLVNPAYLTRMVHELGDEHLGHTSHITSLNPIRPENAADPWEQKALQAFEGGARDYSEVLQENGRPVLRYMGAFLVESSCLSCHAEQGYKVGDVRGGISVTVPVGLPIAAGLTHKHVSILTVLTFWLMGGLGIFLWVRRLASTSRKQENLIQDLELSSLRFRLLFESSPAPMLINSSGRLLLANTSAARMLDAERPEDLIGLEVSEIIGPAHRAPVAERIRLSALEGMPTPPVQEALLTRKGREVWVEVQTIPIELPGGRATLVFALDLSQQRRDEAERRKLEAEVQHSQRLDSLGSLAGGIAHDMNNVLAAVMGMASLLQLKHEADASLTKSLLIIEHAATRGRDLVKGLTDFARKGLHEPAVMDLNALVRKELDLLIRTSRQRFVFEVHLEKELPPIMGEATTLGSAFMNLCVNAFDAMPRGGTLWIRTFRQDGRVILQVQDTGEGIPQDILPRVTEPFFTTKAAGRGTGLGLAMVYGTAKAHGGTLDILSAVGEGTCITLSFPSMALDAAEKATALPSEPSPRRSLQILLVDDDDLIRSTLPPMLEQLGHRVDTASSGLEALRRLGGGLEADLVILDHHMPGLSGAETLPRILQLRPGARIILATGFLDTDLKILLADFPAVLTLPKPFSLAELQRVLGLATGRE